MKTKLIALLILAQIVLLSTLEVKSQEDSLRNRISLVKDTACFNRIELENISKIFIENDKLNKRIEYLDKVKKFDSERIDALSRNVEILNKDISLFKKTIEILNKDKSSLILNNDRLRLTRNISIGIGTIFAIIAIAK